MDSEKIKQLFEEKKLTDIKNELKDMNEYDIAELIQDLPLKYTVQSFRLLPKDQAADVFSYLEDDIQKDLISALTDEEAKEIIEDMDSDDAADLFEEMPAMMIRKLLKNVSKETRTTINKLLKYPENSARIYNGYGVYPLKKRINN